MRCFYIFLFLLVFTFCKLSAKNVTVSVSSYNSASITSNTNISQLSITYGQTNTRKSQLTAQNSLCLKISGKWRVRISKISVNVKSNKSGGAGFLLMTMGTDVIWMIADSKFNSATWYGSYSNEYVTLERNFDNIVWCDSLVLTIGASANSLYFESLSIEYVELAPEPYRVDFVTYTDTYCSPLTEKQTGAGIILPTIEGPQGWMFLGWARKPVFDIYTTPKLLMPKTLFLPEDNTTLYAVYSDYQTYDMVQDTSFVSGEYAIMYHTYDDKFYMLDGFPEKDRVATQECEVQKNRDSLYYITVTEFPKQYRYVLNFDDSTVTIMHSESETYIGREHNATKFASNNYIWRWERVAGNSTLFFTPYRDSTIIQFVVFTDTAKTTPKKRFLELHKSTKNIKRDAFYLFPLTGIPTDFDPLYTSNPLYKDTSDYHRTDIKIVDKPINQIKWNEPYEIFDMTGHKTGTSIHNIYRGIWIIKQGKEIYKFIK